MTLITPSVIWEATDDELRQLIKQAQNELILRHMDKPVAETVGYVPPFADLEAEAELMKNFHYDTPMAEAYGG